MTVAEVIGVRTVVERARSFLFVPGDRPDRFASAERSGADVVVLDLEDGVAAGKKEQARRAIAQYAERRDFSSGPGLAVRISPPSTDAGRSDLAAVSSVAGDVAIMVAKADATEIRAAQQALPPAATLVPLIESARGLDELRAVAECNAVVRLALGHLDLAAELEIDPDDCATLRPVRLALRLASSAAGLSGPVDGVTADFRSDERLRTDVREGARVGFTGKLCIHPVQIAIVHDALVPSGEDLEWARRIVSGATAAVSAVGGAMVDRPVILRAESIIRRSGENA